MYTAFFHYDKATSHKVALIRSEGIIIVFQWHVGSIIKFSLHSGNLGLINFDFLWSKNWGFDK
jgi:hypothetical protein